MKMTVKVLMLVALLVMLFGHVKNVYAATDEESEALERADLSQKEKDEISTIITSLFESTSNAQTREKLTHVSDCVLADTEKKAQAFVRMEESIGADFTKVYHNIDIEEANYTRDGNLMVKAHDTTVVWYSYPDSAEDYFAYGTLHTIVMGKMEGLWNVISDSFDERTITGVASLDVLENSVPKKESNKEPLTEASNPRSLSSISFSYNSTKLNLAISYAIQYCGLSEAQRLSLGYTAWRDNSSSGTNPSNYNPYYCYLGADCCNFVSQILNAAGMPQDSVWYYDTINEGSQQWKVVSSFTNYLDDSYVIQSVYSDYSNVFPGNPIHWFASPEDHIMFCVGYNSAGVPVICCHTNDAYRVPLTNSNYSGKTLYTIKIASTNYHSHSTYIWKYNSGYHYRICNVCEYLASQGVHVPDTNNHCSVCGAQGPFIVPSD